MTNEKDYQQVTCIERWDDNKQYFDPLMDSILNGNAKQAVKEMVSWNALSDLDPFSYKDICENAVRFNEKIVYDDFNYLLTTNGNIIVLYKHIDNNNNK